MNELKQYIDSIQPVDRSRDAEIQDHMDNLTKPQGSLGRLEEIAAQYIRATTAYPPAIAKKTVFVMAGDHGVADEGVSAFPQAVTAQMVLNFLNGGAAINVFARHVGCETKVVDMGVKHDFGALKGLIDHKVAHGTANIAKGPAMTEEQMVRAVRAGIELAEEAVKDGATLIGTGDMGIANTTPSTAIYSTLLGLPPEEISGAGTGLDADGISRKAGVIARALKANEPFVSPLDVLQKVGGFEIAGLVGLIFGATKQNVPVVVDGFISTAAAVVAVECNAAVRDRIFFSHLSKEKGHAAVCKTYNIRPVLDLDLRLGEGTGGALAMNIIDAAIKMYNEMASFKDANVSNKE